jgi:hypothetical protein
MHPEAPVAHACECIVELDENAARYWDQFYSRNANRFFKDRNWLRLEFPELFDIPADQPFALCELGCGAGTGRREHRHAPPSHRIRARIV